MLKIFSLQFIGFCVGCSSFRFAGRKTISKEIHMQESVALD